MKHPIYKFLKENNLTQKSEVDFINEYSNPQKSAELYKFFAENNLTSKSEDDFYQEYFNEEKKKFFLDSSKESTGPQKQPTTPSAKPTPKAPLPSTPNELLYTGALKGFGGESKQGKKIQETASRVKEEQKKPEVSDIEEIDITEKSDAISAPKFADPVVTKQGADLSKTLFYERSKNTDVFKIPTPGESKEYAEKITENYLDYLSDFEPDKAENLRNAYNALRSKPKNERTAQDERFLRDLQSDAIDMDVKSKDHRIDQIFNRIGELQKTAVNQDGIKELNDLYGEYYKTKNNIQGAIGAYNLNRRSYGLAEGDEFEEQRIKRERFERLEKGEGKASEFFRGIGGAILRGSVSMAQVPKVLGDLVGDTDYDWADELYNSIEGGKNTMERDFGAPLPEGKTWSDLPFMARAASVGGNALGSAGLYATGGGLFGGASKLSQGVATFGTAFLTSEADYYQEAIDAGMDNQDAAFFGSWMAAQTAFLESLIPDVKYLSTDPFRKSVRNGFIDGIKSGATKAESIKLAFKNSIKALPESAFERIKTGTKETFVEEFPQQLAEDISKTAVNSMGQKEYFNDTFNPDAYVDAIIGSYVATTGLSVFSRPQSKSPVQEELIREVVERKDDLFEKGTATDKKTQPEYKKEVEKAAELLSAMKSHSSWNNLSREEQNHALAIAQQAEVIKEEQEQMKKIGVEDESKNLELQKIDKELKDIFSIQRGREIEAEKEQKRKELEDEFNQSLSQEYDQKDQTGLPSQVGEGQKPIEVQPIQGAGTETTEASGVLQTPEEVTLKNGAKVTPTKISGQTKFFHASPKKREGRLKANEAPQWGKAIYFATNKESATYEFGGDNVTEASLNLKNPVYTNTKEFKDVNKKAIEIYNREMLPEILKEEAELVNGKWRFFDEDLQAEYDKNGYIDRYTSDYIEEGKYFGQAAKELGYDAIIHEGNQYGSEIAVLDENAVIYPEDIESKEPSQATSVSEVVEEKPVIERPAPKKSASQRLRERTGRAKAEQTTISAPSAAPSVRPARAVEASEQSNPEAGEDSAFEAAGMTREERDEWKKNNKAQGKKPKIEQLTQAVKDLVSGKKSFKDYYRMAKELMPSKLMDKVPTAATFKEIIGAIDSNKLKIGVVGLNKFVKKGMRVGLRIDIPSFNNHGKNVVTVHDRSKSGQEVIGYGSTGSIKNVNFRTSVPTAAKIGTGETSKSAFAMAEGEWMDESPESIQKRAEEAMNSPEWVQVSMNPARNSFFFDKADGNPVVSADEVLQVGNLVLAKNPKKIDLNTAEGMAEFERVFSATDKKTGTTYQFSRKDVSREELIDPEDAFNQVADMMDTGLDAGKSPQSVFDEISKTKAYNSLNEADKKEFNAIMEEEGAVTTPKKQAAKPQPSQNKQIEYVANKSRGKQAGATNNVRGSLSEKELFILEKELQQLEKRAVEEGSVRFDSSLRDFNYEKVNGKEEKINVYEIDGYTIEYDRSVKGGSWVDIITPQKERIRIERSQYKNQRGASTFYWAAETKETAQPTPPTKPQTTEETTQAQMEFPEPTERNDENINALLEKKRKYNNLPKKTKLLATNLLNEIRSMAKDMGIEVTFAAGFEIRLTDKKTGKNITKRGVDRTINKDKNELRKKALQAAGNGELGMYARIMLWFRAGGKVLPSQSELGENTPEMKEAKRRGYVGDDAGSIELTASQLAQDVLGINEEFADEYVYDNGIVFLFHDFLSEYGSSSKEDIENAIVDIYVKNTQEQNEEVKGRFEVEYGKGALGLLNQELESESKPQEETPQPESSQSTGEDEFSFGGMEPDFRRVKGPTERGEAVSGAEAVKMVENFLKASGINVRVLNDKDFDALLGKKGYSVDADGVFMTNDNTGEVLIRRSGLESKYGDVVVFHEGIHPVINIIRNTDPKLYNAIVQGIKNEAKTNKKIQGVISEVERVMEGEPASAVEDEIVTEVFARIASGDVKLSEVKKSLAEKIIYYANKIAKLLGLNKRIGINPSDIEFRDFANDLTTALRQGGSITDVVGRGKEKEFINEKTKDGRAITTNQEGSFISESGNVQYSRRGIVRGEKDKGGSADTTVKNVWNQYKGIKFNGSVKIEDASDVAHIMRQLENKSVEHAFAVHVDEKGKPHIQFLGMGGVASVIVDPMLVLAGAKRYNSKQVYLVHNHPSGSMNPSGPDISITQEIRQLLSKLDISVEHVIVDTYKREFVHIDTSNYPSVQKRDVNKENNEKYLQSLKTEMMDEFEILSAPLAKITNPRATAQFFTQMRFTALPKNGMLVMDRQNQVIGNYILPGGFNYKDITDNLVGAGVGQSVIFYSNEDNYKDISSIKGDLEKARVSVLDYILVDSNSQSVNDFYKSYADEGLLRETQQEYGTTPVEKQKAQFSRKMSRDLSEEERSQSIEGVKTEMARIEDSISEGADPQTAYDELFATQEYADISMDVRMKVNAAIKKAYPNVTTAENIARGLTESYEKREAKVADVLRSDRDLAYIYRNFPSIIDQLKENKVIEIEGDCV